MSLALTSFVDRFSSSDALVVGDAMLDVYLEGPSTRLCQEAPVPVVSVERRADFPGGAANAAVNLTTLGGRSHFVSVVGADPEADALRRGLEERDVATSEVLEDPARRTLVKQRVAAGGQLVVRFDQGTTGAPPRDVEDEMVARVARLWESCDVVVISDYGYGVVTPRLVEALACLQARAPRVLVADAKDLGALAGVGVTAVKPNYRQVVGLLEGDFGPGRDRVDPIVAAAERLLEVTGAALAAVTCDADGAVFLERDRPPYRTFARPTSDSRAAGAGDTFTSTLALALAAGAHTAAAAELASAASAIVVAKERTATCSAGELRAFFDVGRKFVADRTRLAERAELLRGQGRRIVFTNGCFDILHRGHITYLNRAKTMGDVLIVGVNSDASVARLKGSSRPINALEDRVEVVAALSSVDHVVAFEEDTPEDLIRVVRPDIFVKGGDYTIDMLPEASLVASLGGAVHILPLVEDRSTSGIIERVRSAGRAR